MIIIMSVIYTCKTLWLLKNVMTAYKTYNTLLYTLLDYDIYVSFPVTFDALEVIRWFTYSLLMPHIPSVVVQAGEVRTAVLSHEETHTAPVDEKIKYEHSHVLYTINVPSC